jgi:hypothetical protein
MQIAVSEVLKDKVSLLGEYEFEICPRIGEVIQVSGPMGDLDFMKVVRIEHNPVEIPRGIATEDKKPKVAVFVEVESRYSG